MLERSIRHAWKAKRPNRIEQHRNTSTRNRFKHFPLRDALGWAGFELADRLRADPSAEDLTLIALTGYAQEVDRDRTAASGIDLHLAKPIDVHQLADLIRVASMKQT
jgi:CheY-like chemotaxis protein